MSYWLCRGLSDKFDVVSSYAAKRSEFLVRSLVSFVERYRIQAVTSTVNANDFDFLRTYQTTGKRSSLLRKREFYTIY